MKADERRALVERLYEEKSGTDLVDAIVGAWERDVEDFGADEYQRGNNDGFSDGLRVR